MHIHKEAALEETKREHPGAINNDEELEKILINEAFLRHPNDDFNNSHIKTSMKEDEDFVILSDDTWEYLHSIYGGKDMLRRSIKLLCEEGED